MSEDEFRNSLDPDNSRWYDYDMLVYGSCFFKEVSFGKWKRISPTDVKEKV